MSQIEDKGEKSLTDSEIDRDVHYNFRILLGLCLYIVIEVIIGSYMLVDFETGSKVLNKS
jgi:hypothetical protein